MKLLTSLYLVLTLARVSADLSSSKRKEALAHWTTEEMALAQPADIILDDNGNRFRMVVLGDDAGLYELVFVESADGDSRRSLQADANTGAASRKLESTLQEPADGKAFVNPRTITFQATIDASLSDVSLVFVDATGHETAVPVEAESGVVSEMIGGFKDGDWTWFVQGTSTDGSTTSTAPRAFSIENTSRRRLESTGLADWNQGGAGGGQIQGSSGKLYFQVKYGSTWHNSACTGTAIHDNKTGRSLILTAAHCMIEAGVFHKNLLFIPNRDSTTDSNPNDLVHDCSKDPCGCWTPSGGVVHEEYKTTDGNAKLQYDYGFLVVDDFGAHDGTVCAGSEGLDIAVDEMTFSTKGNDIVGESIYGFGYPGWGANLKYCAEVATKEVTSFGDFLWIEGCGLLGGTSGGPQLRNFNTADGTGSIVSVNSWGRGSNPGMGSVIVNESAGRCLVNKAREVDFDAMETSAEGEQGVLATCYERDCSEEATTRRGLRAGKGCHSN